MTAKPNGEASFGIVVLFIDRSPQLILKMLVALLLFFGTNPSVRQSI